jgi:hypothetical protein
MFIICSNLCVLKFCSNRIRLLVLAETPTLCTLTQIRVRWAALYRLSTRQTSVVCHMQVCREGRVTAEHISMDCCAYTRE